MVCNQSLGVSHVSFHVGEDIGDYRIVSIIGAGSFGQVFQVEHRITKRKEALKVLVADHATESQVQRFEREIEFQARLDHPHIARVHNALHVNDSLILVMELVEGESLEKKLKKGSVSKTAGIDYICQTLSALEHAHAQGIVHRDITPGNLIVDQNGTVKLTDFGMAKSPGDYQLTDAGDIVGSLYYMPPEQVQRHADPDPRSDLYSTGAVLYEILTGRKLFDLGDRLSLMVAQVQQQPVAPIEIDSTIGSALNEIVLKALAKDPAERYQSPKEFREALKTFAAEPIATVPPAPVRRRSYFTPVPLSAVALTVLALAFAGVAKLSPESPLLLPPKPAHITGIGTLLEMPQSVPVVASPVVPIAVQHRHPVSPEAAAEESVETRSADEKEVAAEAPEEAAPAEEASADAGDTSESATEPAIASQQPAPQSRVKRFFQKLNPFKRKNTDPDSQKAFAGR